MDGEQATTQRSIAWTRLKRLPVSLIVSIQSRTGASSGGSSIAARSSGRCMLIQTL